MRIALDTNRYSDLVRGDQGLAESLEVAAEVLLPFVVVAELRAGFAAGTRAVENERLLRRFLAAPGVRPLFPTDATITLFASVSQQLRAQGTPIPTHDIWIAALVQEHDLILATRDGHFRHLAQLRLL
jgi:predicted nucleic acid-binding protein